MNKKTFPVIKRIVTCRFMLVSLSLFFVLTLNACAMSGYQQEEQEGGITGTGNMINCKVEQNKKRPECLNVISK